MARLSPAEIEARYRAVIDDYNTTPLAAERGWTIAPSAPKLHEIAECYAALAAPDAVFLDIGTGRAIAPRLFKSLGYRVVTVDNPQSGSPFPLENAALAGIETHACDILAEPLPLADASVDCILFADVIEHLLHSPKPALAEFLRVLKPGGVVVATTPNAVRLSVRLRVLLGISNWPNLRAYFDAPYHRGHHHEYTAAEFRYAFERSGFAVDKLVFEGTVAGVDVAALEELQPQQIKRKPGRSHPLVRLAKAPVVLLERLVPRFRPVMLLVARKARA